MHRRQFLKLAGATAAAAVLQLKCGPRKPPNILFIMSDDHTHQAFGCYGSRLSEYAPTANIDRLAQEGALLKNCFCTNSICVPSRATILTGQYSHMNGAKRLSDHLDPETDNAAKHLQAAGYQTAVIGKWHLKKQPAGFDYYNVLRGQGRYNDPVLYETGADWEKGGVVYNGHSSDVIADQALKWLRSRDNSEQPFCLMCHFKSVHAPFYWPERHESLYENQQLPEPEDLHWPESPKNKVFQGWPLKIMTERYLTNPDFYPPPKLDVHGLSPKETRKKTYQKFIKDYLRTVAAINDNVGRLLDYLEESGQQKETVVIYTADQGYFLGEHNLFDKRFMLEESLRMPFLIRYPREIKKGTVVDDIILNTDFAELFLDYANAEPPASMQGRSFRQNLRGRTSDDWRDSMYYHYWTHQDRRPSHYGIRTKRYKLIYYYGAIRMGHAPEECWEFYDLKTDPHERINQYEKPEYQSVIADLKLQLQSLRRELNDTRDPLQEESEQND